MLVGYGRIDILVHFGPFHRHLNDPCRGLEILLCRRPPNAVGPRAAQAAAVRHPVR